MGSTVGSSRDWSCSLKFSFVWQSYCSSGSMGGGCRREYDFSFTPIRAERFDEGFAAHLGLNSYEAPSSRAKKWIVKVTQAARSGIIMRHVQKPSKHWTWVRLTCPYCVFWELRLYLIPFLGREQLWERLERSTITSSCLNDKNVFIQRKFLVLFLPSCVGVKAESTHTL